MIGRTNVGGGSGDTGATLVVSAPADVTVTATKDNKTYTRIANSDGIATFKGLSSGTWAVSMYDSSHDPTTPVDVIITTDYYVTLAFFTATIIIEYPAGSTCKATHTDGTELTAPDTSGTWSCIVPSAGTWTVSCTDGTNTKSEIVEITSEWQSKRVTLNYQLDIFANGILAYPMEGLKNSSVDTATVTIDGNEMVWTAIDSNSGGRAFNFITTNKIDVTEYNTLNIEYTVETAAVMTEGRNFFGVSTNKKASMGSTDYGAAATFTTTPKGEYILNVPIDAVTGQQYISAFALLYHGDTLKVRVSRLYLVR